MAQTKRQAKRVIDLEKDPVFLDLLRFSQDAISRATHDSLLRFKWAKYDYAAAVAALSYVIADLLAVLNRNVDITPEALGQIAKEAMITVRAQKPDDDDD